MRRVVGAIPFETLHAHYRWATIYGLTSFWHPYLVAREALAKYFFFLDSPRFFRLEDRPCGFDDMVPMRTLGMLHYGKDGRSLLLRGGRIPMAIRGDMELFMYRRSCGKQTAGQIAQELRSLFLPEKNVHDILTATLLPFLAMLEKNYYMTFYE